MEGRLDLTFELDVFEGAYQGLILAEVEFASEEDAVAFTPPEWCSQGRDLVRGVSEQPAGHGKGVRAGVRS